MSSSPHWLEHYQAVRDDLRPPRFLETRAQAVPAAADPWAAHAAALAHRDAAMMPASQVPGPNGSLLDLKIRLAERTLDACDLCPHLCGVNRNQGRTGFCGVAGGTAIHWEGILSGEEIELVPSHEVFLSGCTMRCAFCYSHEHITRPMSGRPTTPAELAALAGRRRREGATNLNLVGGEPTVHIPNILRALRELKTPLPIVWNSNLYATARAMSLLDGVVDLFLGDIHFGNDDCAERLGRIPHYSASVRAAFAAAVRSGASVVIRHLVMPGHLDCCARPAMEWGAQALPNTPFHLMFQYVPDYRAVRDPVLGRFLTDAERTRARAMATEIGVRLYEERGGVPRPVPTRTERSVTAPAPGPPVDVLIQADGRVSFTRLLPDLVPVAAALAGDDARVHARLGRNGEKE